MKIAGMCVSCVMITNMCIGYVQSCMAVSYTHLKSSYRFLERFLEATRANLFFAKGVILVEGDAENLLRPTIAYIIGRPFHRYGVSIVNVGSTAYKRYADIFKRKDNADFGVALFPV